MAEQKVIPSSATEPPPPQWTSPTGTSPRREYRRRRRSRTSHHEDSSTSASLLRILIGNAVCWLASLESRLVWPRAPSRSQTRISVCSHTPGSVASSFHYSSWASTSSIGHITSSGEELRELSRTPCSPLTIAHCIASSLAGQII